MIPKLAKTWARCTFVVPVYALSDADDDNTIYLVVTPKPDGSAQWYCSPPGWSNSRRRYKHGWVRSTDRVKITPAGAIVLARAFATEAWRRWIEAGMHADPHSKEGWIERQEATWGTPARALLQVLSGVPEIEALWSPDEATIQIRLYPTDNTFNVAALIAALQTFRTPKPEIPLGARRDRQGRWLDADGKIRVWNSAVGWCLDRDETIVSGIADETTALAAWCNYTEERHHDPR